MSKGFRLSSKEEGSLMLWLFENSLGISPPREGVFDTLPYKYDQETDRLLVQPPGSTEWIIATAKICYRGGT